VLEFFGQFVVVAVWLDVDGFQRAADADGSDVGVCTSIGFELLWPGIRDVDSPKAHVAVEGPLFEFPRQVLEVALLRAGELPVVIDRQSDCLVIVGPGEGHRRTPVWIRVQSESSASARFERRDHTGAILGLGVEIPRTDKPRDCLRRPTLEFALWIVVADQLRVRPRPGLLRGR